MTFVSGLGLGGRVEIVIIRGLILKDKDTSSLAAQKTRYHHNWLDNFWDRKFMKNECFVGRVNQTFPLPWKSNIIHDRNTSQIHKTVVNIILDFRFRTPFGKTTDFDMVYILLIRVKQVLK